MAMRRLILGTASVLALAIGGAAMDLSAEADDAAAIAGSNMPAASQSSQHWLTAANLSKDDIRWAQLELHNMGFYDGSLDGVVGPETKRALAEFQKSNGLDQPATLDRRPAKALTATAGIGQGSSVPPTTDGT